MFKAVYRRRKIEQILKRCHRPGYVFALRFPIVSRLGTGGVVNSRLLHGKFDVVLDLRQ